MAHPYASHRQKHVEKRRVGHIMKSGGLAHDDAAADKKLFKELINEHERKEMKVEGKLAHVQHK